jgi:hypothetical protein
VHDRRDVAAFLPEREWRQLKWYVGVLERNKEEGLEKYLKMSLFLIAQKWKRFFTYAIAKCILFN